MLKLLTRISILHKKEQNMSAELQNQVKILEAQLQGAQQVINELQLVSVNLRANIILFQHQIQEEHNKIAKLTCENRTLEEQLNINLLAKKELLEIDGEVSQVTNE